MIDFHTINMGKYNNCPERGDFMKRIVILGGGYAGVHAGKIFHKAFKKDKDVEITLIDKNRYHTLMTELHEIAGSRVDRSCVRISFDRIFSGKKVNVVQDEIVRLAPEENALYSEDKKYEYDYLLMGTGAEPTDFGIPGVKEHSFPLWSFKNAVRIRDHITEVFRKASVEKDIEKRKTLMTFAVAGGGFTGVEMVGELIEQLPLLCEEYHIDPSEVKLINVEALPDILNMIPEGPREKAKKYMKKKGVKILLNSLISKAEADSFTLKDGTVIPCGTLIWTCGVKGSSFGAKTGLTIGHVDRLRVDAKMQTPDHKNIYLAGDAIWLMEDEKPVPQIVEAAEQTAAVAANNIIHAMTGKGKEKEFKSNFHGFMVSIGGRYAVSHTGGFSMSGFPAMAIKHLVNVYYLHTVAGVNAWWNYLKHEIFGIENKRSLLGGLVAAKINGLWALPIRLWLGLMWIIEGANKIGEGWFNVEKGSSSAWMFSPGVVQAGLPTADASSAASAAVEETAAAVEAVSAASGEVVSQAAEVATDAVSAASGAIAETATAAEKVWAPIWDTSASILSWDNPVVTWFRETFMDGMAAYIPFNVFQIMVVVVEIALGLALMGGLFTFPAAGVSIIMCLVFIFSGLFSWSQLWFIFAAIVLMGGAGRSLGLDYWAMPWLKKAWNGTSLAQKSYLYFGEPVKKRRKK